MRSLAAALGGEVDGDKVKAPGPNHSPADRSLVIWPKPDAPDGFTVHSFSGDDPIECRDYVRERTNLPAFEARRKVAHTPFAIQASLMAAVAAQRQITTASPPKNPAYHRNI